MTLTADFFTQMRSAMNLQRALVNQLIIDSGAASGNPYPSPPAGTPKLLTTRDVLRFATINGATDLRLDHKTGSLTPEANLSKLRSQLTASRDFLLGAAGIPQDLFRA